jgi:hypothetical protein
MGIKLTLGITPQITPKSSTRGGGGVWEKSESKIVEFKKTFLQEKVKGLQRLIFCKDDKNPIIKLTYAYHCRQLLKWQNNATPFV